MDQLLRIIYHWSYPRASSDRTSQGTANDDSMASLKAQITNLTNMVKNMNTAAASSTSHEINNISESEIHIETEVQAEIEIGKGKRVAEAESVEKAEPSEAPVQKSVETPREYRPPPLYPQRLQKTNQDNQLKHFLNVLKQFHINIPLVEALEQMPNYAKNFKDILTKKRRLGEFETVALTKECSAISKDKLPQKIWDLESFTISVSIGGKNVGHAQCYLGASINLMSLSVY
ncbi:uncharacterized protein LOC111024103 [Momordica charantia]|uniref:Uncharacterized protein LOC111024103 n=1 Tax=Momordica charantia TaxID=3673 RepID=A0A6J1DWD1_MOMCH|nr:uncharacterized protein LOC111024103 [Momordica charantia]